MVDRYLGREVSLGRVIGPLSRQEVPGVHVSRFGVIEKPHQPGKYRLIVDLSHPEGQSVNDGIEADICTLAVCLGGHSSSQGIGTWEGSKQCSPQDFLKE